ncbi:uncharacterized protein FOMMEDRAFT_155395 [Fomitiporia mediterranea MF3/22]|uniref:uncharacterized protein n=1 Tax=Fomitiporia mediterranea (strain MF3/22) TaxID=694068 RepID=UPI0004407D16|nr:uncharacterized protein FOMMEDRAFT_155395 [Fomitiporia mediterranea MF3/22]EJD04275.1 hypothetical protein FOMMEDRAFT_155395 [Fomitiporia mediterranea MF3/22]
MSTPNACAIFGEDDISKSTDLLSMQSWKDSLMEDMIVHANLLFNDKGCKILSLPLEVNLPRQTVIYGASYTQISHALLEPQRPETGSPSTRDFTPTLPTRPGNSIHPSHSSANQSRTTESETDDEIAPPLPPRPTRLEARVMHASESSVSGSQSSLSERPEESVAGTALTSPDATPSSPSPVHSPPVLHSDNYPESLSEHQPQPSRCSHFSYTN